VCVCVCVCVWVHVCLLSSLCHSLLSDLCQQMSMNIHDITGREGSVKSATAESPSYLLVDLNLSF